jgi:hypothetical protein
MFSSLGWVEFDMDAMGSGAGGSGDSQGDVSNGGEFGEGGQRRGFFTMEGAKGEVSASSAELQDGGRTLRYNGSGHYFAALARPDLTPGPPGSSSSIAALRVTMRLTQTNGGFAKFGAVVREEASAAFDGPNKSLVAWNRNTAGYVCVHGNREERGGWQIQRGDRVVLILSYYDSSDGTGVLSVTSEHEDPDDSAYVVARNLPEGCSVFASVFSNTLKVLNVDVLPAVVSSRNFLCCSFVD